MNERTKSRFEVVVTSYGRNKNGENEIKKQEKANNSPNYRYAAIIKPTNVGRNALERQAGRK